MWFGFWDVSNDRSCHAGRIIRGGGLAPTIVILLSLGLWGNSAAPQIGYVWFACLIVLACKCNRRFSWATHQGATCRATIGCGGECVGHSF